MISFTLSKVVVDPVAVARFVTDGGGAIMADHRRRAANVQTAARAMAGKKTRRLERSIIVRTKAQGLTISSTIGSDLPYALWHHEGTEPHEIRPRKRKALRFPKGGAVVFAKSAQHPGTRGNAFLAKALPYGLD